MGIGFHCLEILNSVTHNTSSSGLQGELKRLKEEAGEGEGEDEGEEGDVM
jgi:hypothetical protein